MKRVHVVIIHNSIGVLETLTYGRVKQGRAAAQAAKEAK